MVKEQKKEITQITIGLILSWIFSCIFGITGLVTFISSSIVTGITFLIISAILLPPVNNLFREKMNFELSKGIKIAILIVGLIIVSISMGTERNTSNKNDPSATTQITIVSNSFDDFIILCDTSATNLQKGDIFNKKFKDNYVQWTGIVSSISESTFGSSYALQVKHCPSSFTSDIIIRMKENQKDKLLTYSGGDSITYQAKLTSIGDLLGLSASEGIIIE